MEGMKAQNICDGTCMLVDVFKISVDTYRLSVSTSDAYLGYNMILEL